MHIKIHKSYRNVVALADSNLIGKKFEEGNFQLDVRENFYNGEEIDKEKAKELLIKQAREDSTFNIVGPESIKVAIEAGIITENQTSKIEDIPYGLTLL